jgi:hypothetical protein
MKLECSLILKDYNRDNTIIMHARVAILPGAAKLQNASAGAILGGSGESN